ncbi:MAG: hypothetical protein MZV64_72320 [Ignavibacteriales bacterium]|nr:hypothetical protein [Ignavibacteriales bacterium]
MRRRYVATFYESRFWAHPGAFTPEAVAFMTGALRRRREAARELRELRVRPRRLEAHRASGLGRESDRDADPLRSLGSRPLPRLRPHGRPRLPEPRRPLPRARRRALRAVGGARAC